MDFMKVIDQTVREIKREVNLKVLKVPEIEQKVLDATDDEPWGPHGTALAEIAQATKKFSECQMVMNVLWTRLTETDRNWRHVYKALAVIEYLVANGSERAVDEIIEHTFQISSLSAFEYVEPNGKDSGINVRKKVENIAALLNDKDKIQAVRNKAAANRDKYVGLSSTGITFKSSSTGSLGSFQKSDRYGGFGSSRDGETFKDSFKDRDQSNEDKFEPGKFKPRRGASSATLGSSSNKGSSSYGSTIQDSSAASASNSAADKYSSIPPQSLSSPSVNIDDDDFDDFDPRGTSKAKVAAGSSPQVDLFGQSLIGDLLDAPTSGPTQDSNGNSKSEEVDLFADASFVSAPTNAPGGTSGSENKVDFFASPPASSAVSPAVDFFAVSEQVVEPVIKASEPRTMPAEMVDPFAAVPMNNFDNSDFFGSFSSSTNSVSTEPTQSFMDSGTSNNQNNKTAAASKPPLKTGGFQVKSGVWADSLSRGLIDLNISGPKKADLTDVGIVGGLSAGPEEKDKGFANTMYMGRAMGTGSGLGKSSGFNTSLGTTDMDDFFSSLSGPQNQYGSFQK
uniref:clathrin interactor EPSIN 1 n=1 Tax=Erigeron canadensis TaxID=72917 RepID=UPI001CB9C555|nr:clathrin interactor EPSIN 1 [Erigeron canadensis]